jgi:hypothetical protein
MCDCKFLSSGGIWTGLDRVILVRLQCCRDCIVFQDVDRRIDQVPSAQQVLKGIPRVNVHLVNLNCVNIKPALQQNPTKPRYM